MIIMDNLDYDIVLKVAQYMGYDPKQPKEFNKYINEIKKMNLWDISKILFFGNQFERNTKDKS